MKFKVSNVKRVSPPEVWMEYTLLHDKHFTCDKSTATYSPFTVIAS